MTCSGMYALPHKVIEELREELKQVKADNEKNAK